MPLGAVPTRDSARPPKSFSSRSRWLQLHASAAHRDTTKFYCCSSAHPWVSLPSVGVFVAKPLGVGTSPPVAPQPGQRMVAAKGTPLRQEYEAANIGALLPAWGACVGRRVARRGFTLFSCVLRLTPRSAGRHPSIQARAESRLARAVQVMTCPAKAQNGRSWDSRRQCGTDTSTIGHGRASAQDERHHVCLAACLLARTLLRTDSAVQYILRGA